MRAAARQGGSTTVIHEVDEVLKRLLGGGALAGSGIDVAFDAPTRDWAARRNAPTINAYLYDIREDVNRRQRGAIAVNDERDVVREAASAAALVPAVVPGDRLDQAAAGRTPAAVRRAGHAAAPRAARRPTELPGALGALGLTVPLTVAGIQTEARSLAEIWSALGGELKPSLDLVITAPFPAYPEYDAGPPVTEGAAVRVRGLDGTLAGSPERAPPPGTTARGGRAVRGRGTPARPAGPTTARHPEARR